MQQVLKRNFALILVLSLVACLTLVDVGEASTWRVERDGSGDYLTIQPAVDASAPGDTILIGPGHYTEAISVQPIGWDSPIDAFVYVSVRDLTFIGSSVDDVIIGPEAYYSSPNLPFGFLLLEGGGLIEKVTIQNVWNGLFCPSGRIESYSCDFIGIANVGLYVKSVEGLFVDHCQIIDADYAVATFAPCSSVEIRNSEFVNSPIYLQNTPSVTVADCNSTGGLFGIQFDNSAGSVSGCEMSGQVSSCVTSISGSIVSITNCQLNASGLVDNGRGVVVSGEAIVSVESSIVTGTWAAISVKSSSQIIVNNSQIEKTGLWFVHCQQYGGPEISMDFSNNYWGTTDVNEISAGIWDRNDDPSLGPVIVFEPINEDPISASEPKSFGSFKAMFR